MGLESSYGLLDNDGSWVGVNVKIDIYLMYKHMLLLWSE